MVLARHRRSSTTGCSFSGSSCPARPGCFEHVHAHAVADLDHVGLKPFMTAPTNSSGLRSALRLPRLALPSGFNSVSTAGGTTSKTLIPSSRADA